MPSGMNLMSSSCRCHFAVHHKGISDGRGCSAAIEPDGRIAGMMGCWAAGLPGCWVTGGCVLINMAETQNMQSAGSTQLELVVSTAQNF